MTTNINETSMYVYTILGTASENRPAKLTAGRLMRCFNVDNLNAVYNLLEIEENRKK